jgi:hypothetical protein
VSVAAVADGAQVTVSPAHGNEDGAIPLSIAVALADTDGSETLGSTIVVSGVPAGAVLSAGADQGGGVWHLTQAQLAGLTVTPPADSDVDFTLTVSGTSTEISTGQTGTGAALLAVTVDGVADMPSLSVANAAGNEDSRSRCRSVRRSPIRPNPGDHHRQRAVGRDAVRGNQPGRRRMEPDGGAAVRPHHHAARQQRRRLHAQRHRDGDRRQLDRVAVGDARGHGRRGRRCAEPSRSRRRAATRTARSRCRSPRRSTDPSESLAITVGGVPAGATLNHGTDLGGGLWSLPPAQLAGLTITPPSNSDTDFTLSVTATSTDSGGLTATTSASLAVTVAPVRRRADADRSRPAAATKTRRSPQSISAALTDPSETLAIAISGVPSGAALSAGIDHGAGVWTLTPAQLAGLTITPAANSDADFTLTVTATATDGGSSASTSQSLAVTVAAVADTPTVVGGTGERQRRCPDRAVDHRGGDRQRRLRDARRHRQRRARGRHAEPRYRSGRRRVEPDRRAARRPDHHAAANSDTDFTLSVTATATDTGGLTATTSTSLAVTVRRSPTRRS